MPVMNDTTEKIAAAMCNKFRKKSNQERMPMGFAMFDTAKTMMLASRPNLSVTEKRKMLFLRLYGNELDSQIIKKVLAHLESLPVQ
jgi:site-specific recombinase XerD